MPGPGEPLWLEDDRRDALALLAEEGDSCPGCGGQLDETTDPENEFRWKPQVMRCHRCHAQRVELDSYAKEGDARGLLVTAVLERDGG